MSPKRPTPAKPKPKSKKALPKHKSRSLPAKKESKVPSLLLGVLALGFLIRIFYLFSSIDSPFYEPLLLDPAYYHQWALRILSGDFVGEGVFHGLPLYPFLLALGYKLFYSSILAIKIVQLLLGVAALFFFYKIGEKIATKTVGMWAAFLGAIYGPLFFHEVIFVPESLAVPLYAAGLYLAILFWERQTFKRALALGLVLGLATLTKAGMLLFVLVFAAGLILRKKMRLLPTFLFLFTFCLALAPVTLHNYVHGKDVVLLTSHGGLNFYIGNNPKATGVFTAPEGVGATVKDQIRDSKSQAEKTMGKELKPSEVSKFWSDKAWDYIQTDPGGFLKLCVRKLGLFLDARELSDIEGYQYSKTLTPFLALPWLTFGILGPLFLVGFLIYGRGVKYRFCLAALFGSYLLGVVLFFVNARYRLPMLCVFFPLGALSIVRIYEDFKANHYLRLSACILVFAAGLGVTQLKLVDTNWVTDHVNTADAYLEKGEASQALDFYKKALTIDPKHPKGTMGMGLALSKLSRVGESKKYYERVLGLDPNNAQAHNNLGMWHNRNGNPQKAKELFLKAIELDPNAPKSHNNLAMVYGNEGRNEEALKELEISLKLDPASPRARTNYGLVLYRLGRKEDAVQQWEKVLEDHPDFEDARKILQMSHQN